MRLQDPKIIGSLVGLAIAATLSSVGLANDTDESQTRSRLREEDRKMGHFDEAKDDGNVTFSGALEGYLSYAMDRNPSLRASFERWRSSVHSIAQARRLPDPKITYGFFLLSVETRLGPQRHRLGLSQTFPWPTRLTAGAEAQAARARAAERRFDARVYRLQAAVAEAYWSLWLVRETKSIQDELLQIARSSSETVRARLVVSQASLSDQQQVDLFVSRLEDSIGSLEQKEIAAEARLAAVIGAPAGSQMPTTPNVPQESLPTESASELRRRALEHPFLLSFDHQADSSEAQAKRARADRLPSFTVGVDWIEVGETSMPNVADSGRDALMIGIGISLPLWQRNYSESVEAALADAATHRWEKQAAADLSLSMLEVELSKLRDSYRRIRLHEGTLIPQASAALESVLGSYASGRAGVSSVLLAERELLELRVELAGQQAKHQVSWARLEETVGGPLESRGVEMEEDER